MAEKAIPFRLEKISTKEFATFLDNLQDGKKMEISIGGKFSIAKNAAIACEYRLELIRKKSPVLVLSVACEFGIEDKYWESLKSKNKKSITFSKKFLQHLAVITVGSLRGVLHAKTEGTEFNNYLLPTINVTEYISENMKFDLPK